MLALSNYNKPSHPLWQRIGDISIFGIMLYIPIIMSLPIDMTLKLWITNSMTFVSSTIKLISKFTLDPNYGHTDNMESAEQQTYSPPITTGDNSSDGAQHPVI